jgi:hypothetical protein
MHTLILQNKPRKSSSGNSWTIEVIGGDSAAKDMLRGAINASWNTIRQKPPVAP